MQSPFKAPQPLSCGRDRDAQYPVAAFEIMGKQVFLGYAHHAGSLESGAEKAAA